jgi:hypothetical protein
MNWEHRVNERLDRLERRGRVLWIAVALLAAALAAGLAIA